jgi:gas vesicle protein
MGRFVIGFVVGAAVGATVVILITPRSGEELIKFAKAKFDAAVVVGKESAAQYEQQMWQEFHKRVGKPPQQNPPDSSAGAAGG